MSNPISTLSLKDRKKQLKQAGQFFTPAPLAEFIASFIDVPYTEVYDPACGVGGLFSPFPDTVKKYGQDINADAISVAKNTVGNFEGVVGDVLTHPAFCDKKFKAIIANPPFSVRWQTPEKNDPRFSNAPCLPPPSKADFAFLLHILYMLADDGVASVLSFPGVLYRSGREAKLRQYFIEQNVIDSVIEVDGGLFEDTAIATVLLIFRKNKQTTDVRFIDKSGKQAVIPFEVIKKNNFNLSVNHYIQNKPEKELIDIDALNSELYESFFNQLENHLELFLFEKQVLGINRSLQEIKSRIETILHNAEQKWQAAQIVNAVCVNNATTEKEVVHE